MKKLLFGLLLLGFITACGSKDEKEEFVNIGITQIVDHPSLNEIRRGVTEALEESKFSKDIIIDYQNPQGDFATAQMISDKFNKESNLIVAITTPSAQAAQNKIKSKPIFFTGVTNPIAAGLSNNNITGVSDMSPIKKQVELIRAILPNTKTIGTIYNTSEANSVFLIEKFEEIANSSGYKVVSRGVTDINDMAIALDSLLKEVDVLYTTKDNTVANAYSLIVERSNSSNTPIIGATTDFTSMGALASVGTSEYSAGYQVGEMITRYLSGEAIEDMKIEYIDNVETTLNRDQAELYGVDIDIFINNGGKVIN